VLSSVYSSVTFEERTGGGVGSTDASRARRLLALNAQRAIVRLFRYDGPTAGAAEPGVRVLSVGLDRR